MADYLVARDSAVIRDGDRRRVITRGKTVLRADDPLVKGREHLFKELEPKAAAASAAATTAVEQATAEPGERRSVRRPKRTQDTGDA